MDETHLNRWFSSLQKELYGTYLQYDEPWKQSGFSGPEERWVKCRKPIADCIDKSGSFLDIGCANGYLLECVLKWTAARNLNVIPFGLDLSEKLTNLAKQRLPEYKQNIYTGNGWSWLNPVRFDFVRTEIVYVPAELQRQYIERIIDTYLADEGELLLTEYRSRKDPVNLPWLDLTLEQWGLKVTRQLSGFYDEKEMTRVMVISKRANLR
ncbi:MAG: class I SAM-dependent methyltransferase [Dehalococcoidales bacterium]|jgi:SAM-dependent methyltransferase